MSKYLIHWTNEEDYAEYLKNMSGHEFILHLKNNFLFIPDETDYLIKIFEAVKRDIEIYLSNVSSKDHCCDEERRKKRKTIRDEFKSRNKSKFRYASKVIVGENREERVIEERI